MAFQIVNHFINIVEENCIISKEDVTECLISFGFAAEFIRVGYFAKIILGCCD